MSALPEALSEAVLRRLTNDALTTFRAGGTRYEAVVRPGFRAFFRAAIAAVAFAVVAGCVTYPHPHDVVELSPVSGTLRDDGEPVTGRRVTMNSVWNTEPCAEAIAEATTDEQGRFHFDEITSRHLFRTVILAPSSPTYSMTVCSVGEAGAVPIFATSIWAVLPRHLELGCDLGVKNAAGDHCEVEDWTGYNFLRRADLESEYGTKRGEVEL